MTKMIKHWRRQWQDLRAGEPGGRFQHLHRQRHQADVGRLRRGLRMAAALGLGLLGLVLIPAPGPGVPILLAGMAALATESQRAARWLDGLERWLRQRRR